MANDHRRTDPELAQGAFLLDDPAFLKEIVQRVVQELLELQMTEHLGAAPPNAPPGASAMSSHEFINERVCTEMLAPSERTSSQKSFRSHSASASLVSTRSAHSRRDSDLSSTDSVMPRDSESMRL